MASEVIRIDVARAVSLSSVEFMSLLESQLGLPLSKDLDIEEFGNLHDARNKALFAIKAAQLARQQYKDVFLDFGASIEEFLPRAFEGFNVSQSDRTNYIELSRLAVRDDQSFIEHCYAEVLKKELSRSNLDYYSTLLERARGKRITVLLSMLTEAKAQGNRCWFSFDDFNEKMFDDLFGLSKGVDESIELQCDAPELAIERAYDVEYDTNGEKFRWVGNDGPVRIDVLELVDQALMVEILVQPHPNVAIHATELLVNGDPIDYKLISLDASRYRLAFEMPESRTKSARILFKNLKSVRPSDVGENTDGRVLAMRLYSVRIEPVRAEPHEEAFEAEADSVSVI